MCARLSKPRSRQDSCGRQNGRENAFARTNRLSRTEYLDTTETGQAGTADMKTGGKSLRLQTCAALEAQKKNRQGKQPGMKGREPSFLRETSTEIPEGINHDELWNQNRSYQPTRRTWNNDGCLRPPRKKSGTAMTTQIFGQCCPVYPPFPDEKLARAGGCCSLSTQPRPTFSPGEGHISAPRCGVRRPQDLPETLAFTGIRGSSGCCGREA